MPVSCIVQAYLAAFSMSPLVRHVSSNCGDKFGTLMYSLSVGITVASHSLSIYDWIGSDAAMVAGCINIEHEKYLLECGCGTLDSKSDIRSLSERHQKISRSIQPRWSNFVGDLSNLILWIHFIILDLHDRIYSFTNMFVMLFELFLGESGSGSTVIGPQAQRNK